MAGLEGWMQRLTRNDPLPDKMQGRWVIMNQPSSELIVDGGEVTCFGQKVEYDYKEITEKDGALSVSFEIDDEADEDTFQRANITGLAITPDGGFFGYNVKFGCQFVRPES